MQRIEENLQPLRDSGEIRNIYSITGMNGSSNTGFLVLTLAPWADRDRTQNQIAADVTAAANKVPALRGNAMQPNSLRIRGAGNGLQMAMVGSNYQALTAATQKLLLSMEESGLFETPRFDNEPNRAAIRLHRP